MKTEKQIRKQVKKLWIDYCNLSKVGCETFTDSINNMYDMDVALAKFETLNWVFDYECEKE